MPIELIESRRRTQKSVRGAFVSIALHAVAITLAVYASASAGEPRVTTHPDTLVTFYPPNEPQVAQSPRAHPAASHSNTSASPTLPRQTVLRPPAGIPEELPRIDPSAMETSVDNLFSTAPAGNTAPGAAGKTGSESGEPMFAAQVEKPALARIGNPIPKYPSLLERSRVEGSVLVQFVVDTLGHAEMTTFIVLQSSNELFARSLQETLPKWRFYPAEAGGRKVKQIVQLPLRFVAPPLH